MVLYATIECDVVGLGINKCTPSSSIGTLKQSQSTLGLTLEVFVNERGWTFVVPQHCSQLAGVGSSTTGVAVQHAGIGQPKQRTYLEPTSGTNTAWHAMMQMTSQVRGCVEKRECILVRLESMSHQDYRSSHGPNPANPRCMREFGPALGGDNQWRRGGKRAG